MQFHILCLFPELFDSFQNSSLLGKAVKDKKISFHFHCLKDFGIGRHKRVDDKPFGGGSGMLLKPEPIYYALKHIEENYSLSYKILLNPKGNTFSDKKALEFSKKPVITLICGRYQGFDKRVSYFVDEEVSIGNYILSGGEVAAMVLIEAISRKLEGVVGNPNSLEKESHQDGFLEADQYTRPRKFLNWEVPETLVSGYHSKIEKWKLENRKQNE